jgi:hypothetical protein
MVSGVRLEIGDYISQQRRNEGGGWEYSCARCMGGLVDRQVYNSHKYSCSKSSSQKHSDFLSA